MLINVGIIEDEVELASAMQKLLNESEGFNCTSVFHTADDAIKNIPTLHLDVVLTDIHLNGKTGIDCITALKPICKNTLFLICTSYEDSENVFNALKAGAAGYLVKSTKPSILLDAITDAYNGGAPMSSQIAKKVVESFHSYHHIAELEKLSPREQEVLEHISKGYRYKEIADILYISTTTVRKHVYNIYEKLQVNSKMDAINKVYRLR